MIRHFTTPELILPYQCKEEHILVRTDRYYLLVMGWSLVFLSARCDRYIYFVLRHHGTSIGK